MRQHHCMNKLAASVMVGIKKGSARNMHSKTIRTGPLLRSQQKSLPLRELIPSSGGSNKNNMGKKKTRTRRKPQSSRKERDRQWNNEGRGVGRGSIGVFRVDSNRAGVANEMPNSIENTTYTLWTSEALAVPQPSPNRSHGAALGLSSTTSG